jgi:HD-like signal output (HDOD) protein
MNPVKPTIDSLVNDAAAVYSLPLLYERLNTVINHPRSSVADITKILSEDVGLSSSILKLANSPMFGYHTKIDSICNAVTIIGTQQLRDMALAVSVIGIFKGIPEDLINMTSFWQHSIAVGIVGRILATYRREANVERFFVSGILHDIGQLILCTRAPALVKETIAASRESGKPHFMIQRAWLGYDHGDVGGALLKRWRIPAIIAEPVAFHHAPERAQLYPIESSLMHVANVIGHAMQIGFSGEPFVPPLDVPSWERLAIPVRSLAKIIDHADTQLAETLDILSGDVIHE